MDYSILSNIQKMPNEEWLAQELINTDQELSSLKNELDSIALDSIPFDKTDAITIFAIASLEIILDFFLSDPANPNSFASKCNSTNNPIGEWLNNIHKKIEHKGNPLDFQGRFTANGESILHGSDHVGNTVNFSGGDHRERTIGHDLFRCVEAIMQYYNGKFSDGGYIGDKYIKVESFFNQYDNQYAKLGIVKSVVNYSKHMFADFFSTKGLPVPGWSFISHSNNRELRKMAADMYKDGYNLRTELLKGISVAIPEIVLRIVQYARYRKSDYSKDAKKKKLHLMLLISHGIATAVNIGKVVITENPVSINMPMIIRTCTLVWSCIKDQVNFNNQAITKSTLDIYRSKLELKKTMIIAINGVYYTTQYQQLTEKIKLEFDKKIAIRHQEAMKISNLLFEYNHYTTNKNKITNLNYEEIKLLHEELSISSAGEYSLCSLVDECLITDKEIDNITIEELINQN